MTTVDDWDDGGEIEDYTRLPYPEAWDRDPDDGTDAPATGAAGPERADDDTADDADGDGDEGFGRELLNAAYAWYRAMNLLIDQGFPPEDCEAEVMRRCAKVSRHQRAMTRDIEQAESEYGKLAADESVCDFPWGRLCPDHGKTLREGRRGCYCEHEGCERRWPVGYSWGHCDQPAAVLVLSWSAFKKANWRLCAGHQRLYPGALTLRTFPSTPPALRVAGRADRVPPVVESAREEHNG